MAMPIRLPQEVRSYAWRGLTMQILGSAGVGSSLSVRLFAALAARAGTPFRERNPLQERRSSDGPAQQDRPVGPPQMRFTDRYVVRDIRRHGSDAVHPPTRVPQNAQASRRHVVSPTTPGRGPLREIAIYRCGPSSLWLGVALARGQCGPDLNTARPLFTSTRWWCESWSACSRSKRTSLRELPKVMPLDHEAAPDACARSASLRV